ncbi:lamin tail domain-containing protein [Streptomyces sp. NPDC088358]|uniref:lamin tail domain-containing protein n=1 Tax=Streptomyces sp. NPDC088358 TaxID=3365857 RepID=UPI003826CC95
MAAYRSGAVTSDVQYDFPGFDDRSDYALNREWIDVANTSRRSVNLDGWTLSDEDGHTYTLNHYRLDGRSTVRVTPAAAATPTATSTRTAATTRAEAPSVGTGRGARDGACRGQGRNSVSTFSLRQRSTEG